MASSNISSSNDLLYSYLVNQDNAPGFIPANEHEQIGPDAFFVSGGTVFIDDTVNNQILVYQGEVFQKAIALPDYMNVKLLYYNKEEESLKVVYENRYEDYICSYLTTISVTEGKLSSDYQVLSDRNRILLEYCFDSNGNLVTQYYEEESDEFALASSDVAVIYGRALDGDNVSTSSIVLGISDDATYKLHTVYRLDEYGATVKEIITVEEGDNISTFVIPEMHEEALTCGLFQTSDNGELYQMVVSSSGINIYKLSKQEISLFTDECLQEREVYSVDISETNAVSAGSANAATYSEISASTVRQRMETYLTISWTFNSSRNSIISETGDPGKVTQPSWLTNLADGQDHVVTNVPYCWGGWNAETFITNINNKKFAGNVNASSSSQVSGTVGMDCSGYVSNGVRYVNTYEENRGSGKIIITTARNYQSLLNSGYSLMRYMYLK